jgi:magnesium transporter
VVQSLANPGFVEDGLWGRLAKVFLVAVVNGILLSLIVLAANLMFGGTSQRLSIVVSIALFAVVLAASLIGTITPLILNRFKFNPALASGPFITTTNDLLGLAIYFLTIHLIL